MTLRQDLGLYLRNLNYGLKHGRKKDENIIEKVKNNLTFDLADYFRGYSAWVNVVHSI